MTDLKAREFPLKRLYRDNPNIGSKSSWLNFIFPALCLTLACVIYTFNLPDNPFIRSCFKVVNLEHLFGWALVHHPVMKILRNHLPDTLWALFLLHILVQVWRPSGIRSSLLFVVIFIAFTVSRELSQLTEFIPGRFDIIDTSIYFALGLIYIIYQTSKSKNVIKRRKT